MKSMTGYARREAELGGVHLSLEIKSYNNRYLDIVVSLPGFLSSLEMPVREELKKNALRGRVECAIRTRRSVEQMPPSLNEEALDGYVVALERMRERLGIEESPALSDYLGLEGVFTRDSQVEAEQLWRELSPLLSETLSDFDATRAAEGLTLKSDIAAQLSRVEAELEAIQTLAPEIEATVTQNLKTRFEEVLGDKAESDRMYAELAVLLVRFSINEELVRLRTHIDTFRESLDAEGAIGKKLDFLSQELNREINTISSKSILLEVSRRAVEAKDAIENIREQLRNIE